jgi:hypothetical protein
MEDVKREHDQALPQSQAALRCSVSATRDAALQTLISARRDARRADCLQEPADTSPQLPRSVTHPLQPVGQRPGKAKRGAGQHRFAGRAPHVGAENRGSSALNSQTASMLPCKVMRIGVPCSTAHAYPLPICQGDSR